MTAVRRKKSKRRVERRRWPRPVLWISLAVLAPLALWILWPFWQLAGQFADRPVLQPSRLYAAPVSLGLGSRASAAVLRRQLEADGYADSHPAAPAPGQFQGGSERLVVHLRATPTRTGHRAAGLAAVEFGSGTIERLVWAGEPVDTLELEAPLLGAYYGPDRLERRPVRLEDLPEHLTSAVLAAEDSRFFDHRGISPRGMLRALWVNLRAGGVRQGGSTLTQQLVKNLFLTPERKLRRKLREMVLAILIDWRYSKPRILNAYLNEIYWGQRRGVSVMGVGAAAEAYFGKEASRLSLCESALLAGIIKSPGSYDPGRHPERARERRDWVLARMNEEQWLDDRQLAAEQAAPLCYRQRAPRRRVGGEYFRDAVRAEVRDRFGIETLADAGYTILTTLDLTDQAEAESAVAWGVGALEEGWEKDQSTAGPLEAALVSIAPESGAVTAYVGGRDYGASQFDRVRLARRQAGSAFKPVVYATAFEQGVSLPAGLLLDEALTVEIAGAASWQPQNSDRRFRGRVTARQALEESLNVPTARLAIDTGLEQIAATASRLGIGRRLAALPAIALGALEVTPLELATVYATLAGGGVRRQPHTVRAVLSVDGRPVSGRPLPLPEPAISPESAYLVTSVLEGVFDRGTARIVRQWGMSDPLAGKTGTTNDRRDSWFAGYSPDRATLVWVGYDDNSSTRLSGSRAALPIWNRFTWNRRPTGGYQAARPPAGVTTATVDPLSGQLATQRCPTYTVEYFPRDRVPSGLCPLHASRYELRAQEAETHSTARERRFKRWLDRVFKRKKKSDRNPP